MLLNEVRHGNLVVAALESDRLTADIAAEFKSQLRSYFDLGDLTLILDLSTVKFIDSSGLGALVCCLKTMRNEDDLVVCGIGGAVASMFKLTRMDRVFRIFPTLAEAIAHIERRS